MNYAPENVAPPADEAQRAAADGRISAWVAASAGTGKTKVLTDRVLNLLLLGTPPQNILCLTFTKAAAAEMSNRLYDRLSNWAVLGEGKLGDDIAQLQGARPQPDLLAFARQLFARVLDAPGGMRILTIHAFCQAVLRRFPIEAGVAPNFEVMDERSAEELIAEVQNRVMAVARDGESDAVAEALAKVAARADEGAARRARRSRNRHSDGRRRRALSRRDPAILRRHDGRNARSLSRRPCAGGGVQRPSFTPRRRIADRLRQENRYQAR
jgi:ATP-dependent helicase/nuclease subunit A